MKVILFFEISWFFCLNNSFENAFPFLSWTPTYLEAKHIVPFVLKIEGVMNSRDGHLYNPNKRHEITTFMTTRGEGYKASVTIIF